MPDLCFQHIHYFIALVLYTSFEVLSIFLLPCTSRSANGAKFNNTSIYDISNLDYDSRYSQVYRTQSPKPPPPVPYA